MARVEMDKLTFIKLWDIYQVMLTPTQREIGDMYFNLDLSLSEIAEQKGISRAGVSECLKTCKNAFTEFESKLHILALLQKQELKEELLRADLDKLSESLTPISSAKTELGEILSKDYSLLAEQILNKKV